MANTVYNEYKNALVTGAAGISTSSLKLCAALVTTAYTPAEADTAANWTSAEVSTAGSSNYTRQTLANVAVTTTTAAGGTDDYIKLDADDVEWLTATISASGAVLYLSNTDNTPGTPGDDTEVATSVAYVDFGSEKSSSAGTFKILWSATNGILNFKQTAS